MMKRAFAAVGRGEDAIVAFLRRHWFAGLILLLGGSAVALWQVPQRQRNTSLTIAAQVEAEDRARATMAQILGGFYLLAGLYFIWRRLESAREGKVTERLTRAVEQLGAVDDNGHAKLELRLGGIYALERIARDSEKDHWPIMEIVTAYLRAHARLPEGKDGKPDYEKSKPVATDIQAVIKLLGRRARTFGNGEGQRLDLDKIKSMKACSKI
jgi:hypothetical protein